jgi:hypothetical protein
MADIARAEHPTVRRRWPSLVMPRLRLLPSLGGLTTLAGVAVAIVVATSVHGGAANPSSAAAAVLQRAARAAEASGGPGPLLPGEYWYVKSDDSTAGVVVAGPPSDPRSARVIVDALGMTERQVWIGVDRKGLIEARTTGPITFLSTAARRQWVRDGRPRQMNAVRSGSLPDDAFDRPYRQLIALPTNVNALFEVIQRGAGKGSPAWKRHEMFTEIGDLLREDPLPAKVRAALYLVAARIPGIRMLGLTHDGIGRPALAITLNDTLYGQRDELLFDPHTAALLGESEVVTKPVPRYHVKPGTIEFASTYITSGIVQRIGQVPHRR